jgi:hypothetical protein
MNETSNGNGNGKGYMRAGSATDMILAYAFRSFVMIAQGIAVLLLWALLNMAITIRDDTRDLKKEWPEMQKAMKDMKDDIAVLKRQGETFATKKELENATTQVTAEFKKLLDEQLKQNAATTKDKLNYAR